MIIGYYLSKLLYLHIETNDERANIHIITGITNETRSRVEKMAMRIQGIEPQGRQRVKQMRYMRSTRILKRIPVVRRILLNGIRRRRRERRIRESIMYFSRLRIELKQCPLPDEWKGYFETEHPARQADIFRTAALSQCLSIRSGDSSRWCTQYDTCPIREYVESTQE